MARRDNPHRDKVIFDFISQNQPCSSYEILNGAKFQSGRLLKEHKRLNLSISELNPLLRRNPKYIGSKEGKSWVWRTRL
jgi:hypothetical protein